MRRLIENPLLGRAAILLATHLLRLSRRPLAVAVLYHRVDEDRFERQLNLLRRTFRLVPASELARAASERRRGERLPLALTFDDDLRSHVAHAAPALRRAGARATFFLCGASLEGPASFWWERLERAEESGLLTDEVLGPMTAPTRDAVVVAALRATPAERDALSARLAEAVGPDPADAGLRPGEIRALAADGMEIGFHTRRHDFLPTLDDEALERAMADGRDALERLAGPLTAIAYPHGGGDQRVARAAREAGFACGFRVGGAAVAAGDDPLLLSRVEAPLDSTPKLALMLTRALLRRWAA